MYRRSYREDGISVPHNYRGNAFDSNDFSENGTCECTESEERDGDRDFCNSKRTEGKEENQCDCEKEPHQHCNDRMPPKNSGSILESIIPSLSQFADNSELLLLFICVMLYTDGKSSSNELLLIMLFLLCMK